MSFSERKRAKSNRRPQRLNLHVPRSVTSDRWDKSPRQARTEIVWRHCKMKHSVHPTHTHRHTSAPGDASPSGNRLSGLTVVPFIIMISTASLAGFNSQMLNESPGILFGFFVCVFLVPQFDCVFMHQQILFCMNGGFCIEIT